MSQFRPGQANAIYEAAKARGMVDTGATTGVVTPIPSVEIPAQDSPKSLPKGKQPNKTEATYLHLCEAKKRRGEISSYRYEGITLKWGTDAKTGQAMRYTPDVLVNGANHPEDRPLWICIEVKGGHIFDRDIVRFKGCRAEWPEYDFQMWQRKKGEWTQIL